MGTGLPGRFRKDGRDPISRFLFSTLQRYYGICTGRRRSQQTAIQEYACAPVLDAENHAVLGVPVQVTRYDGMMHGLFTMAAMIDQGRKAVQQAAAALRTAFAS
jgi:hypothetical protein